MDRRAVVRLSRLVRLPSCPMIVGLVWFRWTACPQAGLKWPTTDGIEQWCYAVAAWGDGRPCYVIVAGKCCSNAERGTSPSARRLSGSGNLGLRKSTRDAFDQAETDEVAREVANLLARKLGVADWLELGEIELRCRKLGAWQGTSVVGEDEDGGLVTEDLTMFNACVEVVRGGELFPPSTASYDPLLWARVDDFLRMVVTREVGLLRADLDELLFCAYGLCLQTTARLIAEGGLD